MSDNGFDSIAQAVLTQKQMMDELQAENRELRRQVADLRAGHGIFIEIAGMRFPLKGEIVAPQAVAATNVLQQEHGISSSPTSFSLPEVQVPRIRDNEAIAALAPMQELPPVEDTSVELEEQEKVPTFLEEIMIDEFATASTSPMTVWQSPIKKQQQEQIDEEQKAALRRELMGSFLLE